MPYNINRDLVSRTHEELSKREQVESREVEPTIDNIILCAFARTKNVNFDGSKEIIHKTFFELKQQFPQLFSTLTFMTCENYPFSKQLEQIYFRFQQAQAISVPNPLYKRFQMNPETKEIIQKQIGEKGCEKYKDDIDKIAKILEKELGV